MEAFLFVLGANALVLNLVGRFTSVFSLIRRARCIRRGGLVVIRH